MRGPPPPDPQFEERVEFYCPYFAADGVPPYPRLEEVYRFTECCGEKCCTQVTEKQFIRQNVFDQEEKDDFKKKQNSRPGWCYDWLAGLGFC